MQAPRIRCGSAAFWWGVLRGQCLCPTGIGSTALRRFLQHPGQVAAGIKVVLLCRFNQAEQDRTALGTVCGIGKQEVFARDHKRFDAAFGAVIAEFNAAVLQIGRQCRPLVFEIVQSNAQLRLRRGGSCICPC